MGRQSAQISALKVDCENETAIKLHPSLSKYSVFSSPVSHDQISTNFTYKPQIGLNLNTDQNTQ